MTELERQEGFISLFNGRDLTGWKPVGTGDPWRVKDGVLDCNGDGRGWIRPVGKFDNFILRLDFAIAEDGNSGIFLRTSEEGRPAFQGMEIQILDDAGEEVSVKSTGAIYDSIAPSKDMSKPAGEWNATEISCLGPRVKVVLNGETVIDVDVNDRADLKDRLKIGYIGLQNHHSGVSFRDIRLKEITVSQ